MKPIMKLSRSNLLSLVMVAALLAIALAGRHFSPLLLPRADATGIAEPGCSLQTQACAAKVAGGIRLQLSITPRPIPYLQPLQVDVAITGIQANRVEIDFAGESMNMGYIRSPLAAKGPGRYTGTVSLPVCVSGGMTWIATVIIESDHQRIAVPYRFDTGR